MSGGWEVGDLAVYTGGHNNAPGHIYIGKCKIGAIRRVDGVVQFPTTTGLVFNDDPSPHPTRSWDAVQWRKIRPDEHEGNADDWNLLTEQFGAKVKA